MEAGSGNGELLIQTEGALRTFYHESSPVERQSAHKWLVNLQNSSEGWQLCWKLLMEGTSPEVNYFGANVLHYKLSRFWKEVPEQQYVSVRTEIVKLIGKFAVGQRIVLSKLNQCLAAFLLNAAPEFWINSVEQSVTAIQDATNSLQEHQTTTVVLEFLTILADEFNTTTFAPQRKSSVRPELQEYVPELIRVFEVILKSQASSDIKCLVLRCLSSWITFGLSLEDCDLLLPILFRSIASIELVDNAAEVLSDLISSPSCFNLEDSLYKFIAKLISLEDLLLKSIAEQNNDISNAICKVVVSTGETYSRHLIYPKTDEQESTCIALVKIVLHCTGITGQYPTEETCSETTFSFWYALQDELMTVEHDTLTDHQKSFFGAFMSLVQILFKKVQFPDDNVYCDFSDDEKEQFRCYRHDVQDTVMYIYSFLKQQCLHYLVELLKYLLSGQTTPSWMEIEGVLFLIQGIAEYVEEGESTYMPEVFSLLTSLPSHPKIADRAILMVGAFSEWLECHPTQLYSTLPLLQSGLTQKEMASSCSLAIRDISRECAQALPETSVKSLLLSCRDALVSPALTPREKIRCVESFGYVVSVQESRAIIEEMHLINQYLVQELQRWFSNPINNSALDHLKNLLQYYAALFRTVDPSTPLTPHPLLSVCHTLQPSFKQLAALTTDEDTVNALVTCITKLLENVREALHTEITDIAQLLLTVFTRQSHESVLHVSGTLVCLFASETQGGEAARALFQRLTELCVERMENGELNNSPGCVQSFFDFVARVLRTEPNLVLDDNQKQIKIIQCCLHALSFQEKPTVKSTCNLLVNYSSACAKNPERAGVFNSVGQSIVSSILLCIAGRSPRSAVEFLADVLFVFNKNDVTMLAMWMRGCMGQEGFPSPIVTDVAKEQFQKLVLREKVNKRRLKEKVNEFSLMCRGLYGTAYAAT